MSKPNNIVELRNFLAEQLQNLADGKLQANEANSISHLSNQIINTVKMELQYAKLLSQKTFKESGETKHIEYIEGNSK